MKRIAAFEKVSFAQYEKDFADAFPGHETAEIRAIYDDITKPKRATAGSAGYDFSAPVVEALKAKRSFGVSPRWQLSNL